MSKRANARADAANPGAVIAADDGVQHPAGTADVAAAITGTPQRHRFAEAATCDIAASTGADFTPFVGTLQDRLTMLAGLPCRVTATIETAPGEPGAETIWHTAPDSSWLGIALSPVLAEALVSQRCGGALSGDGGQLSGTASVVRLQAGLVAAILGAAAASWLTAGDEWHPAATATARSVAPPRQQRFTLDIAAQRCALDIAVALASPAALPGTPASWAADLRRVIDHVAFPVRAVLFETRLPLAKAAQLRPGDVLPIETPRDVGLRVGAYRLAAGTVAPGDDGGHLVTIRASARSFRQPASEKAPL